MRMKMSFSTEKVKSMYLDRRKCILVDENLKKVGIQMDAFEDYSRSSCLLECRARKLYDECKCLPYYYPNFAKVWGKDTTCSKDGLRCLANYTGVILNIARAAQSKNCVFQ